MCLGLKLLVLKQMLYHVSEMWILKIWHFAITVLYVL